MNQLPQKTIPVASQASYLLGQAVAKSMRTSGIQLVPEFVRSNREDRTAPLAQFLRGGQGGEVRLKLYLTMILIATKSPHKIDVEIPAATWAEMLNLSDPRGAGARRVSDALSWLAEHHFVELDSKRGRPPIVTLRSALGTGTPYKRGMGQYIKVPLGLWEKRWIYALSGRELGLLLILLDLQGGKDQKDPPFVPARRRRQYGLSDDTWKRAQDRLVELGLLNVAQDKVGGALEVHRLRNTFWIDVDQLDLDPPNLI